MATNCTLLPGPPPTPPELMLGQREVATGHQGSVAAAGDPRAPIAGAGCQEAPQPQQEGAAGATGVHARLGPPCPPLSAATPTGPRPARTRAHAPYTVIHALGTLRATQRAPQTPDTPRRLRALHAQAERAQAPAALRPPAPARSPEPPSHGCRRDTRRSPAAVRAGTRMPAWTRAGSRV